MLAVSELFQLANIIEAAFWCIVAIGFALSALRRTGPVRTRCWIAAVVFFLFGISDLVETQTGAWYRPWWLLVWKGLCLLVIVVLSFDYLKHRGGPRE